MVSIQESMPTKKPQVTVYVRPIVNEALDRVAGDEQRSRSQMAAVLIEEALKARGFLQDSTAGQQDKAAGQDSRTDK